jgi:hypothetical protein
MGITFGQEFDNNYIKSSYNYQDCSFELHDFIMGDDIKVKYFSRNSADRFMEWRDGKEVMLLCSGAFSETWEKNSKPVGLTIDYGQVINKDIDKVMDGLVTVNNYGNVSVIDLDAVEKGLRDANGDLVTIDPRGSYSDKITIMNIAEENDFTIFQTQLVYSKHKTSNFIPLNYGKSRERRFFAICTKNNLTRNVIIDVPDLLPLNKSASYTKVVLEYAGYTPSYILNLDTGDKNVFYYRTDLKNISSKGNNYLDDSTNLIVFYKK